MGSALVKSHRRESLTNVANAQSSNTGAGPQVPIGDISCQKHNCDTSGSPKDLDLKSNPSKTAKRDQNAKTSYSDISGISNVNQFKVTNVKSDEPPASVLGNQPQKRQTGRNRKRLFGACVRRNVDEDLQNEDTKEKSRPGASSPVECYVHSKSEEVHAEEIDTSEAGDNDPPLTHRPNFSPVQRFVISEASLVEQIDFSTSVVSIKKSDFPAPPHEGERWLELDIHPKPESNNIEETKEKILGHGEPDINTGLKIFTEKEQKIKGLISEGMEKDKSDSNIKNMYLVKDDDKHEVGSYYKDCTYEKNEIECKDEDDDSTLKVLDSIGAYGDDQSACGHTFENALHQKEVCDITSRGDDRLEKKAYDEALNRACYVKSVVEDSIDKYLKQPELEQQVYLCTQERCNPISCPDVKGCTLSDEALIHYNCHVENYNISKANLDLENEKNAQHKGINVLNNVYPTAYSDERNKDMLDACQLDYTYSKNVMEITATAKEYNGGTESALNEAESTPVFSFMKDTKDIKNKFDTQTGNNDFEGRDKEIPEIFNEAKNNSVELKEVKTFDKVEELKLYKKEDALNGEETTRIPHETENDTEVKFNEATAVEETKKDAEKHRIIPENTEDGMTEPSHYESSIENDAALSLALAFISHSSTAQDASPYHSSSSSASKSAYAYNDASPRGVGMEPVRQSSSGKLLKSRPSSGHSAVRSGSKGLIASTSRQSLTQLSAHSSRHSLSRSLSNHITEHNGARVSPFEKGESHFSPRPPPETIESHFSPRPPSGEGHFSPRPPSSQSKESQGKRINSRSSLAQAPEPQTPVVKEPSTHSLPRDSLRSPRLPALGQALPNLKDDEGNHLQSGQDAAFSCHLKLPPIQTSLNINAEKLPGSDSWTPPTQQVRLPPVVKTGTSATLPQVQDLPGLGSTMTTPWVMSRVDSLTQSVGIGSLDNEDEPHLDIKGKITSKLCLSPAGLEKRASLDRKASELIQVKPYPTIHSTKDNPEENQEDTEKAIAPFDDDPKNKELDYCRAGARLTPLDDKLQSCEFSGADKTSTTTMNISLSRSGESPVNPTEKSEPTYNYQTKPYVGENVNVSPPDQAIMDCKNSDSTLPNGSMETENQSESTSVAAAENICGTEKLECTDKDFVSKTESSYFPDITDILAKYSTQTKEDVAEQDADKKIEGGSPEKDNAGSSMRLNSLEELMAKYKSSGNAANIIDKIEDSVKREAENKVHTFKHEDNGPGESCVGDEQKNSKSMAENIEIPYKIENVCGEKNPTYVPDLYSGPAMINEKTPVEQCEINAQEVTEEEINVDTQSIKPISQKLEEYCESLRTETTTTEVNGVETKYSNIYSTENLGIAALMKKYAGTTTCMDQSHRVESNKSNSENFSVENITDSKPTTLGSDVGADQIIKNETNTTDLDIAAIMAKYSSERQQDSVPTNGVLETTRFDPQNDSVVCNEVSHSEDSCLQSATNSSDKYDLSVSVHKMGDVTLEGNADERSSKIEDFKMNDKPLPTIGSTLINTKSPLDSTNNWKGAYIACDIARSEYMNRVDTGKTYDSILSFNTAESYEDDECRPVSADGVKEVLPPDQNHLCNDSLTTTEADEPVVDNSTPAFGDNSSQTAEMIKEANIMANFQAGDNEFNDQVEKLDPPSTDTITEEKGRLESPNIDQLTAVHSPNSSGPTGEPTKVCGDGNVGEPTSYEEKIEGDDLASSSIQAQASEQTFPETLHTDKIHTIKTQIYEEGLKPCQRDGGVSFFIPMSDAGLKAFNSGIGDRLAKPKRSGLTYEERMLMADINRHQQLSKKKEFAVKDLINVKSATGGSSNTSLASADTTNQRSETPSKASDQWEPR